MRALVVDDEPLNRDLLGRMLKRLGWDSVAVAECTEALALLDSASAEPFDLIFMDLCMPGMDGYACAACMHKNSEAYVSVRKLPTIVAVTGSDQLDPKQEHLFGGILRKPFSMDELRATLEAHTGRS